MPCVQKVKVTYTKDTENKPETWELVCEGKCRDGSDCKKRTIISNRATRETREFCACSGAEPEDCHIVLYTHTDEKGKVTGYFKCEFDKDKGCAPPEEVVCVPVPVPEYYADAPTLIKSALFECQCTSKDYDWPKK